MRKLSRAFVGLAGVCSIAACQEVELDAPAIETAPIVGGASESGYPAAGALVELHSNGDYYGSYCSATLIAPQWVLTAGHCTRSPAPTNPSVIYFYTGTDANNPVQSQMHKASQVITHEGYNEQTIANDIALVKLAAPITSITPIPINQQSLASHVGEETRTIGYGLTTALNDNTGGVKRSALVPISDMGQTDYWSEFEGTGTCYGDSGGPSILQVDGTNWVVVGVTSNGPECHDQSCGGDDCRTGTSNTRVDAYKSWINDKIGGETIDCRDDASVCGCAEACTAAGTCNEDLCPKSGTCEEGLECWYQCQEQDCSYCDDTLSTAENTKWQPLYQCLESCYASANTQDEFDACLNANCADEWETCVPTPTGGDDCGEVYDCWDQCTTNDCVGDCYVAGTAQAQDQFDALGECLDGAGCLNATSIAAFEECRDNNCADEYTTCTGNTVTPTCTDNDEDGVCGSEGDCNDNDRTVVPGREEICGNDRDDNCANGADEGCNTTDPTTSPTSDPTTSPGEDVSSPGDDTGSSGEDATNGGTSNPTGGTSNTSGAETTGNKAVGSKSDGCAGGGAEAPALVLAGLALVALRRRRIVAE